MNSQTFDSTKPNGRKQFQQLLDTLLDYNLDSDNDDFNDIHIRQEEMLLILEWEKIPYSHEWGGKFQYIDYDEVVMKEVTFPDGHYEYLFPEDIEETLKEWHEAHPEWVKTDYGTWTNMEENRRCSIDWNIDKWCERKEQENDSTFQEIKLPDDVDMSDINELFKLVPSDVLYRTGYIVMSPRLARQSFYIPDEGRLIKLGDVTTNFEYKQFYPEVKMITRTFKLYTIVENPDNEWPGKDNEMLFLTDTNYLICALRG